MERYWVTGVQIGLIKAYLRENRVVDAMKLMEEIEEQFIGNNPENSIPIEKIF